MLQIRVSVPDFSNGVNFTDPIILEQADSVQLKKTVNSSDESISFNLPLTDPKMSYITYIRWWECWDTDTNTRLNFGPIQSISRTSGEAKNISGAGRSALLNDYYKSVQTFYRPIDVFLDDLRFENLVSEPRIQTLINQASTSDYYGLSKRTKDYAIDEQTGYLTIGRDSPERGTIKVAEFWSGVGKADYLVVDLGEPITLTKFKLLFPWWGGATINNSRIYDWNLQYSNDNSSYTTVYTTGPDSLLRSDPFADGNTLYFGESGFDMSMIDANPSPITARYWKIDITNTRALYGNLYLGTLADEWAWECGGSNVFGGETRTSPTVSTGDLIPKVELSPSSNCHASIIEVGVYKKILERDTVTNLSYKQIQDYSKQITYLHTLDAGEMIGTKYEPGGFFRKFSWSGSSGNIKDEYNNIIYSGAPAEVNAPAYCRLVVLPGGSSIIDVDAWPSIVDPYSYGASYSYTRHAGDTAILDFRGISIKWFATIPSTETPGTAKIEIRSKTTGSWGAWSTLENSLQMPSNVSAHKVWEITVESGLLDYDTSYQLRITNLEQDKFISIDAFAGYWSGSMTFLNENDARTKLRNPAEVRQLFDGKFLNGSIYKFLDNPGGFTREGLVFTGDRIIVYSRKGLNYGPLTIGLYTFPEYVVVNIPGGSFDGTLTVDLNNPTDIPQFVVFDSNDYFPNGLPWRSYGLGIYKPEDPDPIWVDGFEVHETTGLSLKFLNNTYLDILKSTAEALQMEWDVTEQGLKVVPRLGEDTNVIMAEGRGTTIKIQDIEDVTQVASMLVVSGADIDGIPLSGVVENRTTKALLGRTVQRAYDLRNVSDQFTLIGAARTELLRRRAPQKRITVSRVGTLGVEVGDSFIVKTPDIQTRVRANTITRSQSSSGGTEWTLECTEWPAIV